MKKTMRTQDKYKETPVRSAPALHGSVIGVIGAGQVLVVEIDANDSPHDGWVHLLGPTPPINDKGEYLRTGKHGWVEFTHLEDVAVNKSIVKLEIDWDNKTWTLV